MPILREVSFGGSFSAGRLRMSCSLAMERFFGKNFRGMLSNLKGMGAFDILRRKEKLFLGINDLARANCVADIGKRRYLMPRIAV